MATTEPEPADFFSSLLTPGSSLNPTFLVVLDGAFAALLCIFVALLFLLSGSIHIIVLIAIELCLWASVKWFVAELRTAQLQARERPEADSAVETDKSK